MAESKILLAELSSINAVSMVSENASLIQGKSQQEDANSRQMAKKPRRKNFRLHQAKAERVTSIDSKSSIRRQTKRHRKTRSGAEQLQPREEDKEAMFDRRQLKIKSSGGTPFLKLPS